LNAPNRALRAASNRAENIGMHRFLVALLPIVAACTGPSGPPPELMDRYTLAKQLVKDKVKEIAAMDAKIAEADAKNDLKLRVKHLRAKAKLIDRKVALQDDAFELGYELQGSYGWKDPDPLKP